MRKEKIKGRDSLKRNFLIVLITFIKIMRKLSNVTILKIKSSLSDEDEFGYAIIAPETSEARIESKIQKKIYKEVLKIRI